MHSYSGLIFPVLPWDWKDSHSRRQASNITYKTPTKATQTWAVKASVVRSTACLWESNFTMDYHVALRKNKNNRNFLSFINLSLLVLQGVVSFFP